MFGKLFTKRPTSKFDVVMAVSAGIVAVWKAVDTIKDYKSDHQEENQNEPA